MGMFPSFCKQEISDIVEMEELSVGLSENEHVKISRLSSTSYNDKGDKLQLALSFT